VAGPFEAVGTRGHPDGLVEDLFRREGAALVRLARLFTDDRTAAEDLVQEAFIRLHRSAHRIRDGAKAAAYLRSIVLNLSRDHNRRGLMSLRHQGSLSSEATPEIPEDLVLVDEEEARMADALRSLPSRQRDCLVLRYYLDLPRTEIAATLGISVDSVKTHCRRGLSSLRALLEETP